MVSYTKIYVEVIFIEMIFLPGSFNAFGVPKQHYTFQRL
jgi:hypothetical protein